MSCAASVCDQVRKTWDNRERRMEYGSGSPVLKISTENGPIAVTDRQGGVLIHYATIAVRLSVQQLEVMVIEANHLCILRNT